MGHSVWKKKMYVDLKEKKRGIDSYKKEILFKNKRKYLNTEYRQPQIKGVKKNKPHKDGKYRVWIMYIIEFSLNFLTVNGLSTERHFIVLAAKLNQHVYYKGIMTSKI